MVNSFADYHENDLIIVNSIVTNYKHFGFALLKYKTSNSPLKTNNQLNHRYKKFAQNGLKWMSQSCRMIKIQPKIKI